jgi:UDP-glucose 4-epimerase
MARKRAKALNPRDSARGCGLVRATRNGRVDALCRLSEQVQNEPQARVKVVLTGSRGRIASVLRADLQSRPDWEIHNFSRTAGEGHLLIDDIFTSGVLEGDVTILHLAWSTVPLISERHVGLEWQTDLPWLVQLLNVLRRNVGSDKAHLIFFSSAGTVYGDAAARPSQEDDPLRPRGWHGSAKVAAESLISLFSERFAIPITIVRLSNPYGIPPSLHRPQGVIPILIRAAVQGETFTCWGAGDASKDFIFYTDMVAAVRAIIERRLTGIYNLCAGESHSLNQVIAHIERLTGTQLSVKHSPAFPWDVTQSLLSNERLRHDANWAPNIDLPTGLARTIELFKSNA